MNPEVFLVIPELIYSLYHNQRPFFDALVTIPIAITVVVFLFYFTREILRERRRRRHTRELLALLKAQGIKLD